MENKKKEIIVNSLKILIPLIVVIILFTSAIGMGIITFNKPSNKDFIEVSVKFIINYKDGGEDTYNITSRNITVYGCLLEAADIGNFEVKTISS